MAVGFIVGLTVGICGCSVAARVVFREVARHAPAKWRCDTIAAIDKTLRVWGRT